jgi:hypothetical protein
MHSDTETLKRRDGGNAIALELRIVPEVDAATVIDGVMDVFFLESFSNLTTPVDRLIAYSVMSYRMKVVSDKRNQVQQVPKFAFPTEGDPIGDPVAVRRATTPLEVHAQFMGHLPREFSPAQEHAPDLDG